MISRLLVVTLLFVAVPSNASAHGIGVEAKLEGDRVAVEAFFDDDTPAADAKVTVTTEDGKVVAEGRADVKGLWSFPAPAPGKYKIVVNAGAGHLAKTTISVPASLAAAPGMPSPDGTPPSIAMTESEIVISEGPTRAETTGWRRWLMAGVGLGLIGLLTWAIKFAVRRKVHRRSAEMPPVSRR